MAQAGPNDPYVNVKGDKKMKGKSRQGRSRAMSDVGYEKRELPSFDAILAGYFDNKKWAFDLWSALLKTAAKQQTTESLNFLMDLETVRRAYANNQGANGYKGAMDNLYNKYMAPSAKTQVNMGDDNETRPKIIHMARVNWKYPPNWHDESKRGQYIPFGDVWDKAKSNVNSIVRAALLVDAQFMSSQGWKKWVLDHPVEEVTGSNNNNNDNNKNNNNNNNNNKALAGYINYYMPQHELADPEEAQYGYADIPWNEYGHHKHEYIPRVSSYTFNEPIQASPDQNLMNAELFIFCAMFFISVCLFLVLCVGISFIFNVFLMHFYHKKRKNGDVNTDFVDSV